MNRRNATRTALMTLGLATLAACVVNLSFAMDKSGIALKSEAGTPAVKQNVLVNLADYKEVADHRANIKSFDLDYLDVTIASVEMGTTASTVTGHLWLRKTLTDPPANDILVGTLNAVPLIANQKVHLSGTPAIDAFLLQQLQNAGQFYVIVDGVLDHGVANVVLDFNLHVSMGYDAGVF